MRVNTRALMTTSAIVLAVLGLGASFLPQELLARAGSVATPAAVLMVQLLGALYLGLAALDWMSRGFVTGGIYGRPLTLANVIHFMVGAIALLKAVVGGPPSADIAVMAALYSLLAAGFVLVLFTHPASGGGARE